MTKINYTDPETFFVRYPGREDFFLNPNLCKKQGLTQENLDELKALHLRVQGVLEAMEATDDKAELQSLNKGWKCLQFELQRVWKFEQNAQFHHWYLVPKCRCPKLDNAERWGTAYAITSGGCPIHGQE